LYAQKLYHPDLSGSTRFFIFLVVDHGSRNIPMKGESIKLPEVITSGFAGGNDSFIFDEIS
jgi:hypothetical protein